MAPRFDHKVISARHAMTQQEFVFCKIHVAMRQKNKSAAYRRAFWPQVKDKDTGQWIDDPRMPSDKAIEAASAALLRKEYIQTYIEELGADPADRARQIIYEQAQLAPDDKDAQKAAERILEMEDKLGFKDDAERWAEIMCAIGAEVVVPLPNGGETIFPLGSMFPQYKESLPPDDAILKTIKSLEAMRVTLAERAALETQTSPETSEIGQS